MPRRKTNDEIIQLIRREYGDQFDTSKVSYVNNHTPISLLCHNCGETIEVITANLLRGHGCPGCSGNKRSDTEKFVSKMNELYPNKFSFEKSVYKNRTTPVVVTCLVHGDFKKTPQDLYRGRLCGKCGIEARRKGKDLFVAESRQVHNNKYTYDNFVYVNNHTPGQITCPIHGDFPMCPKNHIIGKEGCPKCNRSKMEIEIDNFLNDLGIQFIHQASKRILPWIERQSLDFYLPQHKIAIECQGEQHFKEGGLYGRNFKTIQVRDKRKAKLCKNHNITLLYYTNVKLDEYPYKVFLDKESLLEEIKRVGTKQLDSNS